MIYCNIVLCTLQYIYIYTCIYPFRAVGEAYILLNPTIIYHTMYTSVVTDLKPWVDFAHFLTQPCQHH